MLKDITNWPNMTIIITSRIERLDGFRAFHIGTLGNKENPKPCLDLFYHYNSNIKTNYKNYNTTALMQLKFLFDITTISKQNVQILINFAVLPDMEKVSEWAGLLLYTSSRKRISVIRIQK